MKTVVLGRSGLEISPITLGTWQLGGDWGPVDEDTAIATIHRARELGVNIFDTAHAYGFGASERLLGAALRDDLDHRRHEVVIATKGGLRLDDIGVPYADSDPAWLREGIESSLEALGIDYVDLYQVHAPDDQRSFEETAMAMAEMVREGLVQHVGVSNYLVPHLAAFASVQPVETLQSRYNVVEREIEGEVLPYAASHDIGVLAYAPLAHGVLSAAMGEQPKFVDGDWRRYAPPFQGELYAGRYAGALGMARHAKERLGLDAAQLAIAWALAHPAVTTVIVGTRNVGHIEDAVAVAEQELSREQLGVYGELDALFHR